MRQIGFFAEGGSYALDHHLHRLDYHAVAILSAISSPGWLIVGRFTAEV